MKPKIFAALLAVLFLTPLLVYAFATLSLSQVDFQSNDPLLAGKAWVLTVVENGNDQYAVGTFTPDQVKTSDGTRATQNLKLEIQDTENTCLYSFQNSYTPIYNVQTEDYGFLDLFGSGQTKCDAKGDMKIAYVKESGSFSNYCVFKTKSGMITPLSTPTLSFKSTIKATVGTETVSGDVSNTAARSVNLGSRAYATWQGSLASGTQCPNPTDTGVMGVLANNQLYITNQAAYKVYDPTGDSVYQCLGAVAGGNTFPSHDQYLACITAYNAKAAAVMAKTSIQPFAGAQITTDTNGAGQARVAQAALIQFPVITMHVKADWLGIYIPVGKPQIVSVSSDAFTETSTGNIRAVVKNIGDGRGSFTISAICKDGAAQAGIAKVLQLDPGTSGYADISITGKTSGQSVSTTCTVSAQDINQPTNTDKKDVTVTVNPVAICSAGEQRCKDQKIIQSCNSAGSQWIDQEVCENGCQIQNGVYSCINTEVCSTDKECDDADPTTTDTCVGVPGFKHCKHVPVPVTDWAKYYKLIGFVIALIIFGIATVFLGKAGQAAWAIVTGILAGICFVGVLISIFALFSGVAAFLLLLGVILILAGIGALQFIPPYAFASIIAGIISIIIAVYIIAA